MTLELSSDVSDRYELLADRLDGFDDAAELVRYVLESTAEEIERGTGATDGDSADDEVVEDRLEQLGYLQK